MIEFNDVYHAGVIVPNIDEAMPELSSRFGVTWEEPRSVSVAILNNGKREFVPVRVCFSKEGDVQIELKDAIPGTVWAAENGSRYHHLGVYVDDLVSEVKRLESEGMKAETWGVDEDGSMAGFCYINDPLGVRIELVSRAGLPPGVGTDPAAT